MIRLHEKLSANKDSDNPRLIALFVKDRLNEIKRKRMYNILIYIVPRLILCHQNNHATKTLGHRIIHKNIHNLFIIYIT